MTAVQIARFIITFAWLYHGLAPKLIQIAPLEQLMSGSIGFGNELTYTFIKMAGISEVIWGVIFFFFYKVRVVLLLNIIALVGLLLAVAALQPQLLIEAFNPVTTNIPLIAFTVIILSSNSNSEQPITKP
ncbi:DoxX-like family protein [Motilimonas eburnea]|uniref:DoxX-like family protein n=1 Tax=Motilimonas eburnea TaxID=1737488 RepID=UPI001E39E63F|nr:DoxX-like family protein [Motilimonas eburnea]